jgi:hypothetical protein
MNSGLDWVFQTGCFVKEFTLARVHGSAVLLATMGAYRAPVFLDSGWKMPVTRNAGGRWLSQRKRKIYQGGII